MRHAHNIMIMIVTSSLIAAALLGAQPGPVTWWTTSSLAKVFLHDSPPTDPGQPVQQVLIKAQAGEIESFQIHLISAESHELRAAPTIEHADPSVVQMSWRKVAHVWCNKSSIYPSGSETGYQPDALLDASYFTDGSSAVRIPLEAGVVHSFWIRLHVSRAASAGQSSLRLVLNTSTSAISVPVSLTVWPILLPSLGASFGSIFTLFYRTDKSGANQLSKYYGPGPLAPEMKRAYFQLLCENRVPADDLYITDPRPLEDYKLLADDACGSPRFNLLDVQAVAGAFVNSSMIYTHAQVDETLKALAPLVKSVGDAGLLGRAYVYGFDERPRSYRSAIRQLFGAIKAAYPRLRTVATLRWAPSADMHIDTWCAPLGSYARDPIRLLLDPILGHRGARSPATALTLPPCGTASLPSSRFCAQGPALLALERVGGSRFSRVGTGA